jgi:hypothetical protein
MFLNGVADAEWLLQSTTRSASQIFPVELVVRASTGPARPRP